MEVLMEVYRQIVAEAARPEPQRPDKMEVQKEVKWPEA
jgi:hypothetical protein